MNVQPFSPDFTNTQTLAATATSANAALNAVDGNMNVLRVANAGPNTVFIRWGATAQTAVTTDMPILAGTVEVFSKGAATNVAAICAAGQTATLYLTCGEGQ